VQPWRASEGTTARLLGVTILVFFAAHWTLTVFLQSFFLHRYGAHRQFTMSKGWEKFFHLATYMTQGSSYLSPRGYAILHRMHHAYSDTPKDPHSPTNHPGIFGVVPMMWATKKKYDSYAYYRDEPEARFLGGYPEWKLVDRTLGQSWAMRLAWIGFYTAIYVAFATHWWMFLLLPYHFVMGPTHGAIVNWCGHRFGYRNYASTDVSRNTLIIDFVTMGELFQNNHHKFSMSPNFANRWFEIDPTYQVMRALEAVGIIDMSGAQVARWEEQPKAALS
jgi:stearoyl-CoA desaturase (delta-9 desaturase)